MENVLHYFRLLGLFGPAIALAFVVLLVVGIVNLAASRSRRAAVVLLLLALVLIWEAARVVLRAKKRSRPS